MQYFTLLDTELGSVHMWGERQQLLAIDNSHGVGLFRLDDSILGHPHPHRHVPLPLYRKVSRHSVVRVTTTYLPT